MLCATQMLCETPFKKNKQKIENQRQNTWEHTNNKRKEYLMRQAFCPDRVLGHLLKWSNGTSNTINYFRPVTKAGSYLAFPCSQHLFEAGGSVSAQQAEHKWNQVYKKWKIWYLCSWVSYIDL